MKLLHFFALAVVLIGGSVSARAAEPASIRIGFPGAGLNGKPVYALGTVAIAHLHGAIEKELAAEGIKVEWQFLKGAGPAVNEALANGQLDFAVIGDLPAVMGRAGGLKTRLLLTQMARTNTYVAVPLPGAVRSGEGKPPVTSIADLKGRTVANFKGTNTHLAANRILASEGLSERDLKVVNLDPSAAFAALASKQVDAAFGAFYMLALRDLGSANIVYTTRGRSPTLTVLGGFLVTEDFAGKYPAIVDRVVRAVVAEAAWTSDEANREAAFELWAGSGLPIGNYREEFDGVAARDFNSPLLDDFAIGRFEAAASDALGYRLVRREVDVAGWLDRGPLDRAIAALGLEGTWTAYDKEGQPRP